MVSRALTFLSACLLADPSHALSTCDRITHVSHGGVLNHTDYGRGKVGWVEWWSQEGVFKDVWLADCQSGQALTLRTHEERIKDRYVPDRTKAALAILEEWSKDAPDFFTLDWMSGQLNRHGKDIRVTAHATEFCACSLAYPDLRGEKTPYKPTQ